MLKKLSQPFVIIVLALIFSVVFYIIQLFYTSSVNNRSSRIYEQSLVASINQYEYLPALIAKNNESLQLLQHPSLAHQPFSERLKFASERSGADAIYLMDSNGKVLATSNYDQKNQGFLNQNYSFRPYFKYAIQEKERQFYYAKGATTGIPGFFISAPVIHNDEAIGVVVVKLDLRHWEEKWMASKENVAVADENNIVILSSIDQWRYKAVKPLSPEVLSRINQQRQFSDMDHKSLYSKSINLNLSADSATQQEDNAFWLIDKKLYLVNHFDIPETGWKLYYLVKHDAILNSSLIFFAITSILLLLAHLNIKNRKRIIESNNKHRLLEIKRREELQTVIDNIHIGVILFSDTGSLLSANNYARHLLTNGESIDKNQALHIKQLIEIKQHSFDSILLNDISQPAYHETKATPEGKEPIPIMFAISRVHTIEQEAYLMTIVNITRRKAAEDELLSVNEYLEDIIEDRTKKLQEAQTKLIQKNKAAALGNMAATIVHELSQPLTAMKSSIAAINAKINNSDWEGVVQSADRLSPLSDKMNKVIKLLKFFSYQDEDSYETVNLVSTVEQTLENLKDTLQENTISHTVLAEKTDLLVKANPLKIDLILSNIIQNAIDALEKTEKPNINIMIKKNKNKAEIIIEDNAGGIDKQIMEKMFNPYFTTKEVGKGLGLGLAITYEIIQEYNGNISVKNHKAGTQFVISLPLTQDLQSASTN